MLRITPAAAAAVTTLLANPDLPAGAGIRLQRGLDPAGESAIGVMIISEPEPGDEAVPAADVHDLFIAPDVAQALDDQVLDAEIDDHNVAFMLHPQAVNGRPPAI